jgi:hypothetical protein
VILRIFFWTIFFLSLSDSCFAQKNSVLVGSVRDIGTRQPLFGCKISAIDVNNRRAAVRHTLSVEDGTFKIVLPEGVYRIFSGDTADSDFPKNKVVTKLAAGQVIRIALFASPDSPAHLTADKSGDEVSVANLTDKDAGAGLRRIPGLIVTDDDLNTLQNQTIISGNLGMRYNQILVNNSPLQSMQQLSGAYPVSVIPAGFIDKAELSFFPDHSRPFEFSGGVANIITRPRSDRKFLSLQLGSGLSPSYQKEFLQDQVGNVEWLGFPGAVRNKPENFPTTHSRAFLNELNIQEQVDLSRKMPNNLGAASKNNNWPDLRVLLEGGTNIRLRKKLLSLVGFIGYDAVKRIEKSRTQSSADFSKNLYPFNTDVALIKSQSVNTNYISANQLGAGVNATLDFDRNSIYLKTLFVNQFQHNYMQRTNVSRPDEDTLARDALYITGRRQLSWSAQLAGAHALGKDNKFRLAWQFAYSYLLEQQPDDRNILLRRDSTGKSLYALARQSAASLSSADASFTNSFRRWVDRTQNDFNGAINIETPVGNKVLQMISGGIGIQNSSRKVETDLYQVQGTDYYPTDQLFAPDRYYPGGLSLSNYYVRTDRKNNSGIIRQTNRPNYSGSSNLGWAFLRLRAGIGKLSADASVRIESNARLVSALQYEYLEGFKYPQPFPLDQNTQVAKMSVLPAIRIGLEPSENLKISLAWFSSISRPDLQELSLWRYYDASEGVVYTGNPGLDQACIENFSADVNFRSRGGFSATARGYYRSFFKPIENVVSPYGAGNIYSVPYNMPSARSLGANLSLAFSLREFLKNTWASPFTLFVDANYGRSIVEEGPIRNGSSAKIHEHRLSGSPDYSISSGLTVAFYRWPSLTAVFQTTGDWLEFVGSGQQYHLQNGNTIHATPSILRKGTEMLNIQAGHTLFKNTLSVIAGVANLLAQPAVRYQDLNGNKKFDNGLKLISGNGQAGFYQSGTDAEFNNIQTQQTFYLRLVFRLDK